jgi:hypothetical protein
MDATNRAVVCDASVLAAIAFEEPNSTEARALTRSRRLLAPSLLRYEMAHVAVSKRARKPDDASRGRASLRREPQSAGEAPDALLARGSRARPHSQALGLRRFVSATRQRTPHPPGHTRRPTGAGGRGPGDQGGVASRLRLRPPLACEQGGWRVPRLVRGGTVSARLALSHPDRGSPSRRWIRASWTCRRPRIRKGRGLPSSPPSAG